MKHFKVYGFYQTKEGKEVEFDREFKSEQASLNYLTKIRDDNEWFNLALTWEDDSQILAEEIGRGGRLI